MLLFTSSTVFKIFHLSLHFCFFISVGLVLFCTLAQFSPWHLSNLFKTLNFNTRFYKYSLFCEFIQTGFFAKRVSSLSASKKSGDFYDLLHLPMEVSVPHPSCSLLGNESSQSAPGGNLNWGLLTERHMVDEQNFVWLLSWSPGCWIWALQCFEVASEMFFK